MSEPKRGTLLGLGAPSPAPSDERADEHEPHRPTLDDLEPHRPTLDDLEAHEPPPSTLDAPTVELGDPGVGTDELETLEHPTEELDPPPRKTRVGIVLVTILLIAALTGPLVFWLVFWTDRPTAIHHLPANTVMAVRFDAVELALYDPFVEHVASALEDDAKEAIASVRHHAGLDLYGTREVLLATADGQSWVLLVGGRFAGSRRAQLAPGLKRALEERGHEGFTVEGDLLIGPQGQTLGQASDGTLIAATERALALAALEGSEVIAPIGLAATGSVSFAIDRPALERLAPGLASSLPEAAVLGRARYLRGWLTLGDRSVLYLELSPLPGVEVEQMTAEVNALVERLGELAEEDPRLGGLSRWLDGARVQARADAVMIRQKTGPEASEELMVALGAAIRAARALR